MNGYAIYGPGAMVNVYDGYTVSREPSERAPGRTNILVTGQSFGDCQAGVFDVMDECGHATFTLPVKTAAGEYVALGHADQDSLDDTKTLVGRLNALFEYNKRR